MLSGSRGTSIVTSPTASKITVAGTAHIRGLTAGYGMVFGCPRCSVRPSLSAISKTFFMNNFNDQSGRSALRWRRCPPTRSSTASHATAQELMTHTSVLRRPRTRASAGGMTCSGSQDQQDTRAVKVRLPAHNEAHILGNDLRVHQEISEFRNKRNERAETNDEPHELRATARGRRVRAAAAGPSGPPPVPRRPPAATGSTPRRPCSAR